MRLLSVVDLGKSVRKRRKELGYSQQQLAEFCGCGTRFVSDLENGKETIRFGKALLVVSMLGLNFYVEPRSQAFRGGRGI